jgi:hypothetical protein
MQREIGDKKMLTSNKISNKPLQVVVADPGEEGEQGEEVVVDLLAGRNQGIQVFEDLGGLLDEAVVGPVGHHGGAGPVELLVGVIVLEFDAQHLGRHTAGSLRHSAVEVRGFGEQGFGGLEVLWL